MEKPALSMKQYLGADQETVLNNRAALGLPTLLITVTTSARSWMIGLDDPQYTAPFRPTRRTFESFQEWASLMCYFVSKEMTNDLVDGAVAFLQNARTWLKPQQLNYALFYLEAEPNGEIVFAPIPAQANLPLRHAGLGDGA